MDKENEHEELDPIKILEEMRKEYWQGLSRPEEEISEEGVQVLVAKVNDERFAMDAVLCKNITKAGRLTRVPRMPSYILGVFNLRGQIVSVVDMEELLGMGKTQPGPKARLVVAESQGVRTAFLVDQVLGIEWVELSRIQEPETVTSPLKDEYIKGHVAPLADETWITYLDTEKMIHGPELSFASQ